MKLNISTDDNSKIERVPFWRSDLDLCEAAPIQEYGRCSKEQKQRCQSRNFSMFEVEPVYNPPLFSCCVQAGFPSPADDHIQQRLDLNHLIKHPTATFFVRVEGDSMIDAGIYPGDLLIVDRAITPQSGQIVVAILQGEFTVKRLKIQGNKLFLLPENPHFPNIEITSEIDFQIWGVVTHAIHSCTH